MAGAIYGCFHGGGTWAGHETWVNTLQWAAVHMYSRKGAYRFKDIAQARWVSRVLHRGSED